MEQQLQHGVPPAEELPLARLQAPEASYWSDETVEVATGRFCRKPPPFAAPKKPLQTRSAPAYARPLLTPALARQHVSCSQRMLQVSPCGCLLSSPPSPSALTATQLI